MDVASERNRVALPGASRGFDTAAQAKSTSAANQSVIMGGMRLPPERFCLTGTGWNMKDEWESEGEEEVEDAAAQTNAGQDQERDAGGGLAGVKEEGGMRIWTRMMRMARWRIYLGRIRPWGMVKEMKTRR